MGLWKMSVDILFPVIQKRGSGVRDSPGESEGLVKISGEVNINRFCTSTGCGSDVVTGVAEKNLGFWQCMLDLILVSPITVTEIPFSVGFKHSTMVIYRQCKTQQGIYYSTFFYIIGMNGNVVALLHKQRKKNVL